MPERETKGHFIGVDGGGSHSRAILVDRGDQVIAAAEGAGLNPLTLGWKRFKNNFAELLEKLLQKTRPIDVEALCAGLAGAGREATRDRVRKEIATLLPTARIHVITDAQAALWGAFQGGPGLLLIAGTGSICLGMDATGKVARAGGYGRLLGDEGGGYWMTVEAVREELKRIDAGGEFGELAEALCQDFHVQNLLDLVPLINSGRLSPEQIAAFAPRVLELSSRLHLARRIVREAGEQLAVLLVCVANKLSLPDYRVALWGGLWQSPKRELQRSLEKILQKTPRHWQIGAPAEPPEWGALRYLAKLKT